MVNNPEIRYTLYENRESSCLVSCVLRLASCTFYFCRESSTNRLFYAKQTQFPKCQDERSLLYHKGLCKWKRLQAWGKQSQSNPIPFMAGTNATFLTTKGYENESAFRLQENKPNQSQFQTRRHSRLGWRGALSSQPFADHRALPVRRCPYG